MSDEAVSQALSLPSAPIARLIDQLLGDNDALIAAAVEAQTAGRLQDMVVYIERLQSNLMRLGKLYDLHALYGGPMPQRQPIPTSAAGADFWKLLEHSARQTILAQRVAPEVPCRFADYPATQAPAAGEGVAASARPASASQPPRKQYWTVSEHEEFLRLLAEHGRDYPKIAAEMPHRTAVQVNGHAQAYFRALANGKNLRLMKDP